jgi:hypothetical protein
MRTSRPTGALEERRAALSMNCWQCRDHAQAEQSQVRAGRGQAGQAAAHFCARLNAFKRLTPLLCNSNEGSAFAHGEPSALRFEPPILHMGQGRAGAGSLKAHIIYVLLIFLSSGRRPCCASLANPAHA